MITQSQLEHLRAAGILLVSESVLIDIIKDVELLKTIDELGVLHDGLTDLHRNLCNLVNVEDYNDTF